MSLLEQALKKRAVAIIVNRVTWYRLVLNTLITDHYSADVI